LVFREFYTYQSFGFAQNPDERKESKSIITADDVKMRKCDNDFVFSSFDIRALQVIKSRLIKIGYMVAKLECLIKQHLRHPLSRLAAVALATGHLVGTLIIVGERITRDHP
jgi:hypothetical protein